MKRNRYLDLLKIFVYIDNSQLYGSLDLFGTPLKSIWRGKIFFILCIGYQITVKECGSSFLNWSGHRHYFGGTAGKPLFFFVINNLTIFCSSGLFNQNWCSSLLFFLYSIFRYKKQSLHLSLSLSPSLLQTNVLQRCHLTKNKNLIFHPARCYFFSCCIRSFQRRGKLLQGE